MPCKKFDIIFLYYVLEHVKNPVSFLANVKKYLRDYSSKLIIEVPNINEALISLYKSSAYNEFVWQRAHYSYFATATLTNLFSRLNLAAELIPVQKYDFSNHIYWLIEGLPGGSGKYNGIFSEELAMLYKENLKASWLCDAILAIVSLGKEEKHEK